VADLSVTKTDGSATYTPGGSTTYTIVVTNNGPSFVTGATVSDALPAGITSATWTATYTGTGSTGPASGSGDINASINLAVGGTAFHRHGQHQPTATGDRGQHGQCRTRLAPPTPTVNNSATDTDTPAPWPPSVTKTDGSGGTRRAAPLHHRRDQQWPQPSRAPTVTDYRQPSQRLDGDYTGGLSGSAVVRATSAPLSIWLPAAPPPSWWLPPSVRRPRATW
jgi:uncharacterized repeat protein (TIGR01451 family)